MYRSRWQRVEEKRNLRKAALLVVATVCLLGLVVIYGVPVLIKLAVVAGEWRSSASGSGKSDVIPPGPPFLLVNYVATNSAQLTVSGTAETESTVYLSVNTKDTAKVKVEGDGNFETKVALTEGNNVISAIAVDEAGNKSRTAKTMSVWYSNKSPNLEIETPSDGQEFSGGNRRVEIKGKTDPESRVIINERIVIVGLDGKFTSFYNLSDGENVLELTAQDVAGNVTNQKITVKYAPSQ